MAYEEGKITWQTLTSTPDGAAGTTAIWNDGTVIWADSVDVYQDGKLFIQGQEYNGTYYKVKINPLNVKYTPPVENYRIILNAFPNNRTLKIISAAQPDLMSFSQVFTCIESNG